MARRPNPFHVQAEKRVGQTLAKKWHLDRLIDIGGMAAVYEATHRNGRSVAVKVLHKIYSEEGSARERFLREGYVANQIGHPGAVAVLDDDELDDGTVFLVMELLDGQSLEQRLAARKTMPVPGVLYIADQVLDVLAAAHDKGIVHRDIKPPNIYLTLNGEAKLLDFGLARVRQRTMEVSKTRTGMVIGTASFMPPEQARGRHEMIDHRTDIWSVAATMFRALTGRYVHEGTTPNERLIKAMAEKAPSLGEVAPDMPAEVVALVDRGLAFQKSDRWSDARTMQKELRAVYEAVEREPIPSLRRLPKMVPSSVVPTIEMSDENLSDIHVSVVIDSGDPGSVIVEFENDHGGAAKVELRRKTEAAPNDSDEITEVSVVEPIDDAPRTKGR